jgi:hypothetical protein
MKFVQSAPNRSNPKWTRTALIGHTGFIGGNLAGQFQFQDHFNSKNIDEIRNGEFDLLVCSGVTAVKWWANQNPVEDRQRIDSLLNHLRTVRAETVLVMSTVDVYPRISDADESFDCHSLPNHPYGAHRLYFEDELRSHFGDVRALRIGGVFGPGLKKNVVFDLIHDNALENINPNNAFQYYNIERIWADWMRLEPLRLPVVNLVTEPLATHRVLDSFFPGKRVGKPGLAEVHYDIRTLHSAAFGGPAGYVCGAEEVLRDLGQFVEASLAAKRGVL